MIPNCPKSLRAWNPSQSGTSSIRCVSTSQIHPLTQLPLYLSTWCFRYARCTNKEWSSDCLARQETNRVCVTCSMAISPLWSHNKYIICLHATHWSESWTKGIHAGTCTKELEGFYNTNHETMVIFNRSANLEKQKMVFILRLLERCGNGNPYVSSYLRGPFQQLVGFLFGS